MSHSFCVCVSGMTLAKHLAICERKSAYPSEEKAKAATATHSMLDVLGLMRRPEEPSVVEKESDDKTKMDVDSVGGGERETVLEVSSEDDKQEEAMDVDEENKNRECDQNLEAGETAAAATVENDVQEDSRGANEKAVTDDEVSSDNVQTSES